uniref:Uncharacterized protein n=1 Tax=Propithecus coquereli TaxID=379532 RepID=A0A2K6FAW1_PROCO
RQAPVFWEPERNLPELVLVPAQPLVCFSGLGSRWAFFLWSRRLMTPGAWTKLPGGNGGSLPAERQRGILGKDLGLNLSSPFASPWLCYLTISLRIMVLSLTLR